MPGEKAHTLDIGLQRLTLSRHGRKMTIAASHDDLSRFGSSKGSLLWGWPMTLATVQAPSDASHPDRVRSLVDNPNATAGIVDVSTSWRRCLSQHGVDPASHEAPRILTSHELKDVRGPVDELVAAAQEEIERLHGIVGKVGYAVLLTSSDGVVVDYRGDSTRGDQFRYWGIWSGAIWSEQVEGTNGIGTCIVEQRPLTVHRAQHFRARHTSLSCCGAPVFGPDGKLAGVLDVTSIDPDVSDRSHALALVVTIESARAIEETLFRRRFRQSWNLVIAPPSIAGRALMLAVDADQRIIGADRNARSTFGLDDRRLAMGVSLWAIFDRSPLVFRRGIIDTTARLIRNGDRLPWRALITPPATSPADVDGVWCHARSRIGQSDQIFHQPSDSRFSGVVASGVQRRVDEVVETHPDQSIEFESMAATVGLSVGDFAQALKQSAEVRRHSHVLHRDIERAKQIGSISATAAELSPRERYILELIGGGQSNKEIARALGIAPETVKSHVKNMFVKLNVERRAQAVYRAQSLGMMVTGYQVPPKRFDEVYQG